ncbi:flagellar export chaperone FliS [Thalassotalea euphylliae]|uniref:Flagellar secretion chaperone FliS n=1 Tax=Thalassotalea euphylliae TaxID=1655234 RepID=A0A3E0U043_9GAMM|nr:flagellar export chaperone FliS [Thalassotalea euphylliae]REL30286.1 flagellar export chaperone FliS [Thalassotalea euphylliae]
MRNNLKAYQKVNRDSGLTAADPHTVILMLYNGLLENIAIGKGAIERKDLALKATALTKAINILNSLEDSLDKDSEPTISNNFSNLYGYCIEQLMSASVSLDIAVLDQVAEFLIPLRDAWQNISEQDKQAGFAKLNERDNSVAASGVGS